jgi:hypothetical protein
MKMHEVSISDPMFWEGPDGPNKIFAEGLGLVYGSPHYQVSKGSYLLRVLHPFFVDGEEVEYLLVKPRLSCSTLKDVVETESDVNIARVKPNVNLEAGGEYGGFDFEGWAIGWIKIVRI